MEFKKGMFLVRVTKIQLLYFYLLVTSFYIYIKRGSTEKEAAVSTVDEVVIVNAPHREKEKQGRKCLFLYRELSLISLVWKSTIGAIHYSYY